MANVCIVYAREDRGIAEKLYALLSKQWDTWWDDDIIGEFPKVIEEEISKADCIVSLFSTSSREKATVIDELQIARSHDRPIIPIKLDDSRSPYPFGTLSCIEMRDWTGNDDHPGFKLLQQRIGKVVLPKSNPKKRPAAIAHGKIPLPSIFMSVSSHETQLVPSDAVRALRLFNAPTILISAYDLVSSREPYAVIKELKKYRKKGGFVLIDSGNYEASRIDDKLWSADNLKEALAQTPHDWTFCFDKMNPSQGRNCCVKEIVEAVERDQAFTSASVLPIVHAAKLKRGGYKLDHIPQIVREVSEKLSPPLIAIPERELGAGLIARAKMVKAIREELNKLPYYQPLHLLGTGNPWSIAILSAAGADTFDGLEWCRYTINPDLEGINHFHHFDLFSALDDPTIGFAGSVAFHNMDYYKSFGNIMHNMFIRNSVETFVLGVIGKKAFTKLKEQFPELFK